MADIALNSAVRSNLRTMQSTTELLNRTEERLSTGKKVNSALDNPSSFFTAKSLERRSGDLGTLLDNVSNSVQTLEAADNGIKGISDILESLKSTARSAQQSELAVDTKAQLKSVVMSGLQGDNLLSNDTTTAAVSTTFAGVEATDATHSGGALTVNGATVNISANDTAAQVKTKIDSLNITGLSVTDNAGVLEFELESGDDINIGGSSTLLDSLGLIADGATTTSVSSTNGTLATTTSGASALKDTTLTFADKYGALKTVTFASSKGADNVDTIDELNSWLKTNDVQLQASVDNEGDDDAQLVFETTNAIANSVPKVATGSAIGAAAAFASGAFSAPVLDQSAAEVRSNYADDYNSALEEILKLAQDSDYNGVNLLNGDDLSIVFNESGSSQLEVKGVEFSAEGLGLDSISAEDFYDSASINSVIDRIEAAMQTVEDQSAKFGSQLQIVQTREDFTKSMIGTLEDGALALTGADTNEEAANLATLQTRQSLIVSSLSISTQQESAVLQLLQ
ncbi:flagellin [Methylopila sp. 73B]|uniref:flagellin N-terminal helical domain-containing protein n=1 Tax=Methylopila sp. 73B TaxID=1120792 RepID=UPI000371B15F|nr:flagellin [Methylopila sp. 73B]